MTSIHICTPAHLHPAECGGNCVHCRREDSAEHDPGVCAMCDPEYDGWPNPYWNRRRQRRKKEQR